jgi:hypothetical protein
MALLVSSRAWAARSLPLRGVNERTGWALELLHNSHGKLPADGESGRPDAGQLVSATSKLSGKLSPRQPPFPSGCLESLKHRNGVKVISPSSCLAHNACVGKFRHPAIKNVFL